MKEKFRKFLKSCTAMALACGMVLSSLAVIPAKAAEVTDSDGDGTINYVSLGASQTNGYGMRYYLDENVYEDPTKFDKATANVYGYLRAPETAYPYLVSKALEAETGMPVELSQLAISSMRAEELHMLLDNEYYGDEYTKWRFYDDNGNGWFAQAEEGGLPALREAYQREVKEADVISVDIGVNNFGVYAINRITGNRYDADLSRVFDEETLALYKEVKTQIRDIIVSAAGAENVGDMAEIGAIVDTFTYALVGFMVNFDASMEKIYELNPDANVVVVSIPNMMDGIEAVIDGVTVPLGDVYGMLVDMANLYASACSPYCESYYYAAAGANGRVHTFLDDILAYNGDPATLDQNMKDCFDVYDDDLHIRIRLQNMFAEYLNDTEYEGKMSEFLKAGEAGELTDTLKVYYETYNKALSTAYDVVATIMQAGAEVYTIDLSCLFNDSYDTAENTALGYIMDSVEEAVTAVVSGQEYNFEFDTTLLEDAAVATVLSMGVRNSIGNSFYAHPNVDGHIQVKNAVMTALKEDVAGKDVAKEEISKIMKEIAAWLITYGPAISDEIYETAKEQGVFDEAMTCRYTPDENSYYVSLGDSSVSGLGLRSSKRVFGYRLTEELGMNPKTQYVQLAESGLRTEDIRYILDETFVPDEYTLKNVVPSLTGGIEEYRALYLEEIEKADLITVGFGNNVFTTFVASQLMDSMLGSSACEMDWNRYVGPDGVAYIESALAEINAYFTENGMSEFAEYMEIAIESYAYAYVGFACNYTEVINKIHEINPDAKVIIVGMYNPLKNLNITMGDSKLPLGDYVDYLVDFSNKHFLTYAMMTDNTTYVEATEVETFYSEDLEEGESSELDLMTYVSSMVMNEGEPFHPNANGHEYIMNQILASIKDELCSEDYVAEDCPSKQFSDLDPNAWYHLNTDYVISEGLMNGTSATANTFSPNVTTSRAMIAKILYSLNGSPEVSGETKFTDVVAGSWYYDAVLWAEQTGVVKGTSATTFSPNANISREQMAVMMYRYAESKGIDVSARGDLSTFSDAETVSSWAEKELSWANAVGLINGKQKNGVVTLSPQDNASRVEAAAIIHRFAVNVVGE